MPRWTYGTSNSGVPLGPIVPTGADSSTLAPVRSASEPRCVKETVYPSPVRMLSVSPFPGVVPEKETTPPDGSENRVAGGTADVDAAALAAGVRMRAVERERAQDRARRPATSTRRRDSAPRRHEQSSRA